jgi:stringent starvation protein B
VNKSTMTSSRPYFIRALYDWIVDNSLTPYLVVFARAGGVEVPQQYVNKEGQIVLNIAPRAVSGLELSNDGVRFSARFGGIPTQISVPCHAVLGVYAQENGQGMMFEPEPSPPPSSPEPGPAEKRPSLRVIK